MNGTTTSNGTAVAPHTDVQVRTGLPVHYIAIAATVAPTDVGATLGRILPQVWNHLAEREVTPAAPPSHSTTPTVPRRRNWRGACRWLSQSRWSPPTSPERSTRERWLWHIGPFSTIPGTYRRLSDWIEEHGYKVDGAPWEVYWTDPSLTPDHELCTEVVWPVRRAEG